MASRADLSEHLSKYPGCKIFLAPNTSDEELIYKAKKALAENGISEEKIQVNYNTQELDTGDLYVSYDPPDLVVRLVYEKKPSGVVKMKSAAMIRI
jgi:undecaprenyl pyrophosphate synthase